MSVSVGRPKAPDVSTTIFGQIKMAAGLSEFVRARAAGAIPTKQAANAATVPTDATRVIFTIAHLLSLHLPATGSSNPKCVRSIAIPGRPFTDRLTWLGGP